MDERIIKYYAGELTREERKALLQEAFSHPELKKEMMDYQHFQSLVHLHPSQKDEQYGKKSLDRFMQAQRMEKRKKQIFIVLQYAACLLIGILSTWWINNSLSSTAETPITTQELSVPAGQRAHITLPDGSRVWVNAGSTIRYPSVFKGERRITLHGEAFFEVNKGETPFIVSTGKLDIKALGTQFNVFNYPSESISIALLEGAVRVYQPGNESQGATLQPNQILTETGDRFQISSITQDPVIWKEGLYAFQQQPLKNILKKLELYYDVEIRVTDTSILEYEYTGKFRQRDGVMEVLRIIQKIHPFHIQRKENSNEIILYR